MYRALRDLKRLHLWDLRTRDLCSLSSTECIRWNISKNKRGRACLDITKRSVGLTVLDAELGGAVENRIERKLNDDILCHTAHNATERIGKGECRLFNRTDDVLGALNILSDCAEQISVVIRALANHVDAEILKVRLERVGHRAEVLRSGHSTVCVAIREDEKTRLHRLTLHHFRDTCEAG